MNEIKFRTWNPKHKYFEYWGFYNDDNDDRSYFKGTPSGGGFVSNQICENTYKYIGLKDKSEKDIYADSDIFKFKYLEELHKPVELIGSFTFNEDDLRYEIDIYNHDRYIVLNYIGNGLFYDFEIIGTIQENPELLK